MEFFHPYLASTLENKLGFCKLNKFCSAFSALHLKKNPQIVKIRFRILNLSQISPVKKAVQ